MMDEEKRQKQIDLNNAISNVECDFPGLLDIVKNQARRDRDKIWINLLLEQLDEETGYADFTVNEVNLWAKEIDEIEEIKGGSE